MQDIATLTGGQVVAPEVGLKLDQVGLEVLGQARRVVVTKDNTTIVDGARRQRPRSRAASTRSRPRSRTPTPTGTARSSRSGWPSWPAASASSRSAPPPRWSSRRRSTASRTPSRRPARPSRRASSPAVAPRWSTPSSVLDDDLGLNGDEAVGVRIVRKSADQPLRWIAENGGVNGFVVVAKVREGGVGTGFNAATERVRRPGRPGRARPGQGDPLRAGQRHLDRRHAADDRDADRREARGDEEPVAAATATGTATATDRRPTDGRSSRPRER